MKFLFSLLATCAVLTVGTAQNQLNLTDAITELPGCAVGCLLQILPDSPYELNSTACICTSAPLQSDLSSCIRMSCKSTDLDSVISAINQLCVGYPHESKRVESLVLAWVPGVITLIIVALRCFSRHKIAGRLWWDDWSILGASLLLMALLGLSVFNYQQNFGEHIWYLNASQFAHLVAQFLAEETFYTISLTFSRISILCFYLRVFQHRKLFRKFVIGMIVLVIVTGTAIFLTTVLQCRPLSALWDSSKPRELSCINLNVFGYSAAGIGIVENIAILLLPLPELLLLQMDLKKKLNVLFMFSVGSCSCMTGMLRLKYLIIFSNTIDFSWDVTCPFFWSMIEICASIIWACLPSVRALLSIWIPSLFRFARSTKGSSQNSDSSHHSVEGLKQQSRHLSRAVAEAKGVEVKAALPFDAKLEEGTWHDNESTANGHSSTASDDAASLTILKPAVYRPNKLWDAEHPATEGRRSPPKPIQTAVYPNSRNPSPTIPLIPTPKNHKTLSWYGTNQDDALWNDRSVLQVRTMSDPPGSSDSDEPDHEPSYAGNLPRPVNRFLIASDTGLKAAEEEMVVNETAVEAVALRAQKVTVVRMRDRRHTLRGQEAATPGRDAGASMENRI